jgi:drug/metabolite transporter (DMT)-like permease
VFGQGVVDADDRAVRIRLSRRSFLLISGYSVLWLAGYTVALNAGERHVDAGTAALLVNLAPLVVAFAAGRFLREGYSRPLIVGALVALGGTAIIAAGATAQRDVEGSCCAWWPPSSTRRGCCSRRSRSRMSTG